MSTDYDDIFDEYKNVLKESITMKYAEEFTILNLFGDLKGKTVLDLACGEGRFPRKVMQRGAGRLIGVDISENMIELARTAEKEHPLGIEYVVGDVTHIGKIETFDIVAAIFLFDYCSTKEKLLTMCQVAYDNLKNDGRLIGSINSTPLYPPQADAITEKYGYRIKGPSSLHDGAPVEYCFFAGNHSVNMIKYHWSKETYEWVLRESGFHSVRWASPAISQKGMESYGAAFWQGFLQNPSFVCFECSSFPSIKDRG